MKVLPGWWWVQRRSDGKCLVVYVSEVSGDLSVSYVGTTRMNTVDKAIERVEFIKLLAGPY